MNKKLLGRIVELTKSSSNSSDMELLDWAEEKIEKLPAASKLEEARNYYNKVVKTEEVVWLDRKYESAIYELVKHNEKDVIEIENLVKLLSEKYKKIAELESFEMQAINERDNAEKQLSEKDKKISELQAEIENMTERLKAKFIEADSMQFNGDGTRKESWDILCKEIKSIIEGWQK